MARHLPGSNLPVHFYLLIAMSGYHGSEPGLMWGWSPDPNWLTQGHPWITCIHAKDPNSISGPSDGTDAQDC